MIWLPWVAVICSVLLSGQARGQEYYEQLNLRPLPQSALLASFNFRSSTKFPEFQSNNYRYFPRSLGQILKYAGTRELHLRFSLGRWDAESWGARPWDGGKEGGIGVELWAWLDAETDDELKDRWLILTNALSGLFCASLNFIDSTRTTQPVMTFKPQGHYPNTSSGNMMLLHGVLPREVVCTENLTPFLKILPCKGKAGISSLLNGHKLFDASWQSMAIDVRPVCTDGTECVLEMEQTIDMVLDLERSKRQRGMKPARDLPLYGNTEDQKKVIRDLYVLTLCPENLIPRPAPLQLINCDRSKPYHADDVCFPIDHHLDQEWTLSQVFGKPIAGTCLATAETPSVCISVPQSRAVYTSGQATQIKGSNEDSVCFHLDEASDFEMMLPLPESCAKSATCEVDQILQPTAPLLYAERSFTGYGQEHGGMQCILTNPNPDQEVEFIYMESLPWFMRVYLHTLRTRVVDSTSHSTANSIVKEIHYRPAIDRKRGTQLEVRMRIPPAATVFLAYDFEKSILRYTEYPPDANRGFDVAAAVITVLSPSVAHLRTTALLLSLPTPDFSMPYNVIIFTSTIIALAFGGMYNIIVRRFVGAEESPSALARFKPREHIAALRSWIRARITPKVDKQ